jgi:hypothetical protein
MPESFQTTTTARFTITIAAALLLMAAGPGPSPDAAVSDGRLRVLLPSRPAAGYFRLDNHGATALDLVSASSPVCGSLMLHRSMHTGGMESMDMVDHVAVPPHGSVQFAPGGYHLMCMQPVSGLQHGQTVPVTLSFAGGGSVTANFAVEGARGP